MGNSTFGIANTDVLKDLITDSVGWLYSNYGLVFSDAYYLDGETTLTIPWRTDHDYRESAPYTMAKLLVPMYGFVELNTADLVGTSSLVIQYRVDRSTGDVIVIINKGISYIR
mgnify:CR=1 FL=1